MNMLETQWWAIALPAEWQAEQEDETIIIGDEDGIGEIVITTLEKEQGQVSMEDIEQFTAETRLAYGNGCTVSVADLDGCYFNYQDQGDAVREWYLYSGRLFILISYSCDIDNAGMDDVAVDQILDTLSIHVEADG